jgi:hypothetical protein
MHLMIMRVIIVVEQLSTTSKPIIPNHHQYDTRTIDIKYTDLLCSTKAISLKCTGRLCNTRAIDLKCTGHPCNTRAIDLKCTGHLCNTRAIDLKCTDHPCNVETITTAQLCAYAKFLKFFYLPQSMAKLNQKNRFNH